MIILTRCLQIGSNQFQDFQEISRIHLKKFLKNFFHVKAIMHVKFVVSEDLNFWSFS